MKISFPSPFSKITRFLFVESAAVMPVRLDWSFIAVTRLVRSLGTTFVRISIGVRLSPSILKETVPEADKLDNSTRILALALIPSCCSFSLKFSATSLAASPAFKSRDVVMPLLSVILMV